MQSIKLLNAVLTELDDFKAVNVVHFDVKNATPITDYMVIASGTSSRHVKALADNVANKIRQEYKIKPCTVQSDKEFEWALVDLGAVVVHIMQPRTRDFYNLEQLWSPASH